MTYKQKIEGLLRPMRKRVEKATPGPYEARTWEFSNTALSEVWTEFGWYQRLPRDYSEPTIELFAHSRTDIETLLALVERQSEIIHQAKTYFEHGSQGAADDFEIALFALEQGLGEGEK
jgi:hypothetical protein